MTSATTSWWPGRGVGRPEVPRAYACRDDAVADAVAAWLAEGGATVVAAPAPAPEGPGAVWRVTVTDGPLARAVLGAGLAGVDLVLSPGADAQVWHDVLDDLRRIASVEPVVDASAVVPVRLPADTLALLGNLAGGASLAEAARRTNLSRRSADRRLAEAREVLGVASTVEAVLQARGHGLI